jgi:hypothetical protein
VASFEVTAVVINGAGVTEEMSFSYTSRKALTVGEIVTIGRNRLTVVNPVVSGVLYLRTTLSESDIRKAIQADQRFQPASGYRFGRCVHWPSFEPGDGRYRRLSAHQCQPGL